MSTERYRWTAFSFQIPLAHASTKHEAVTLGRTRGDVTSVIKRLRGYPFTTLRRYPVRPA